MQESHDARPLGQPQRDDGGTGQPDAASSTRDDAKVLTYATETQPALSIVIPAYNAGQTITAALKALENQTIPRHQYEIIVVDDGSTDETARTVEAYIETNPANPHIHPSPGGRPAGESQSTSDDPSSFVLRPSLSGIDRVDRRPSEAVRLIQQPHRGRAATRNAGAQAARGQIILFLDADCVPASDWIEHMISRLDEDGVVGTGGRVTTTQRNIVPRFIQLEYDARYERVTRHTYIDFISSATAAYRRTTFEAVGGFHTDLQGAEDVDLSFRLSEAGHRLVFSPQAIVYHKHPNTVWEYARRKFEYAFWRAAVYGRHPRKVAHDSRTPPTQKLQIALAPLVGLSLIVGLIRPAGLLLAGMTAALFLATTASFSRYAWRADPRLGLIAPFILLMSATVSAAGLAAGMLYSRIHKSRRHRSS